MKSDLTTQIEHAIVDLQRIIAGKPFDHPSSAILRNAQAVLAQAKKALKEPTA